jgi:hypothetical protein
MVEATEYGVEVTLSGITSLPNFIKIYQLVQKLLVEDRRTDIYNVVIS